MEDIVNVNTKILLPLFQFFRNSTFPKIGSSTSRMKDIQNLVVKEGKQNLINYIQSDEIKDPFYLIPLIKVLTRNKNKSFSNKENLNIVIFEKHENSMNIFKTLWGFKILKTYTFLFIIKNKNYYEPIYIKKHKLNLYCPQSENKEYEEKCYLKYIDSSAEPRNDLNVKITNNNVNGYIEDIKGDKIIVNVIEDDSQIIYLK